MISNFCLYTNLDTLKTEQAFFQQKLLINTNYPKDLDISTLFKACYNEVFPYLSVFLKPYYIDNFIDFSQACVSEYISNEQAIKILEKNCLITSFHTIGYLQSINSTTSFQACLKELMNGESCLPDDIDKLNRIFKEIRGNSYFDQFITLQETSTGKAISSFCPELDLKLILDHQKAGTNTLGTLSPSQIAPLLSSIKRLLDKEIVPDSPKRKYYKRTENLRLKCQTLLEKIAMLNLDDETLFKHLHGNDAFIHRLIYHHNMELIFHNKAIQDFLLGKIPYDYNDEDNGPATWLCDHKNYILLPLTYERASLVSLIPALIQNPFKDVLFALTALFKTFFIALLNQFDFDVCKCKQALLDFILSDIKLYEENYFTNNQSPQARQALYTATYDIVTVDSFSLTKLGELLCSIYEPQNCFSIDMQYKYSERVDLHQLNPIDRIKTSIAHDIKLYFLKRDFELSWQLYKPIGGSDPTDLFLGLIKPDFM